MTKSVAIPGSSRFQLRPLSVERKSPKSVAASTVVELRNPAVTGSTMTLVIFAPPLPGRVNNHYLTTESGPMQDKATRHITPWLPLRRLRLFGPSGNPHSRVRSTGETLQDMAETIVEQSCGCKRIDV